MYIRGVDGLKAQITRLYATAGRIRATLEIRRAWFEDRPVHWQNSAAGERWGAYLDNLERILDTIEHELDPDEINYLLGDEKEK